jgi:ribonuclease P/MRP protein subunit POP5
MIPTMRGKRRYMHIRFECGRTLSEGEARDELYNAILSFVGELGFSKANPKLVEFNDNSGVLVCSNDEVHRVKAALALVSKTGGGDGFIRVLKVSGMIGRVKD